MKSNNFHHSLRIAREKFLKSFESWKILKKRLHCLSKIKSIHFEIFPHEILSGFIHTRTIKKINDVLRTNFALKHFLFKVGYSNTIIVLYKAPKLLPNQTRNEEKRKFPNFEAST